MVDKLLKRILMASAVALLLVAAWKISAVSDDDIVDLHAFSLPGYGEFVRAGDIVGISPNGSVSRICATSDYLGRDEITSDPREYYNLLARAISGNGVLDDIGLGATFAEVGRREANFLSLVGRGQSTIYANLSKGDCECRILEQMLAGGRICVVTDSVSDLSPTEDGLVYAFAVKFKQPSIILPQERVDDLLRRCPYVGQRPSAALATPLLCDVRAAPSIDSRVRTSIGLVGWRELDGTITPVAQPEPERLGGG